MVVQLIRSAVKGVAQCAAVLIGRQAGAEARERFESACWEQQESFMNKALGDARKSEVDAVFASIAESAGVFDADGFSRDSFMNLLGSWDEAIWPAYQEHKEAMGKALAGVACARAIVARLPLQPEEDDEAEPLRSHPSLLCRRQSERPFV